MPPVIGPKPLPPRQLHQEEKVLRGDDYRTTPRQAADLIDRRLESADTHGLSESGRRMIEGRVYNLTNLASPHDTFDVEVEDSMWYDASLRCEYHVSNPEVVRTGVAVRMTDVQHGTSGTGAENTESLERNAKVEGSAGVEGIAGIGAEYGVTQGASRTKSERLDQGWNGSQQFESSGGRESRADISLHCEGAREGVFVDDRISIDIHLGRFSLLRP